MTDKPASLVAWESRMAVYATLYGPCPCHGHGLPDGDRHQCTDLCTHSNPDCVNPQPTVYGCPYSPNCVWRHTEQPSDRGTRKAGYMLATHKDDCHPLGYDDPTPWQHRGGILA